MNPGNRPHSPSSTHRLAKIGAWVALAIILAVLVWDAIELWNWEAFLAWKRQVGYVPFFVGLALLPLVGVPMTPLFVIAGATFSPFAAMVGCAISIAVNLVISYWVSNRWLTGFLKRQMGRWNMAWPEHDPSQALRFLIIVRLTPGLPTFIKNYIAAMIPIPFHLYLGISWIAIFLYAVGFILMGDSLANQDPLEAILAIALLLVAIVLVRTARRRLGKRQDKKASRPDAAPSGRE